MVSIEFIKEGVYHRATEKGGNEEVKIPVGTVKTGLTEAEAYRWERRGVAKRLTGRRDTATSGNAVPMPPAPPAPPESNDPGTPQVTPAPPAPPAPAPAETVVRRGRPVTRTVDAGDPGND